MTARMITLGDMTVLGQPPPKLAKALAVIAGTLHQEYAADPHMATPDKSKESCILCSLTVRDFLHNIGLIDAVVQPVALVVYATRAGEQLHSAGCGEPDAPQRDGRWNGHMVTVVNRWLIDATIYQIAPRPAWPDLGGMMALPLTDLKISRWHGMRGIAGADMVDPDTDYCCSVRWYDARQNKRWRDAPDTKPIRRAVVVDTMVRRFNAPALRGLEGETDERRL
jgi:hypothetical protein